MKKLINLFFPIIIWSQSGKELAIMLEQKAAPKDLKNQTEMVLTNSKGKSRTNRMISKSIDRNQKQIIWFLEPKDDRGVSFLKIEHDHKDDEMRMWLPAFKKVRRISAKKRGDSFMGSDLSFEDLSSRAISNYDYNRLEDRSLVDTECFVLETIPKKESKSSYSKHVSFMDKNTLNIVKEFSYDRNGDLKKEKEFDYSDIEGYQILVRVFVKDVIKHHTTEVFFSDILVNRGIAENFFHEKNLKRLPRD